MHLKCSISTVSGEMTALLDADHLCGLWFNGQKHMPEGAADWIETPDHPLCFRLREQLNAWFAGQLTRFDLPLSIRGTPFQTEVWGILRTIPYGETTTYGAISKKLEKLRGGKRPAPQAVGGAVGRNPLTIIIPCHRVVGADGSLTGYAGGLDRKAALLAIERRASEGAA